MVKKSNNNAVSNEAINVKFYKKLITALVIIIVAGLISVFVYITFFNNYEPDVIERDILTGETINDRGIVALPENIEEIIAQLEEPVEDGYYLTTMNVNWVFDSWDTPSRRAFVENAAENTRTVYFDLILDETGELIYSSPFIPVGARFDGFALDKEVPAGTHSATVIYHLVDDNYESINTTVSVAVQLNILE